MWQRRLCPFSFMQFKLAVSIFVLFLPLAGLVLSREGFPHRQKALDTTEDNLLKKLGIDKFDQNTPPSHFILTDLHGNPVSLRDLRGKVVFLNFWATWCPSCKLEMPAMEELHREFGNEGLVILAINYREDPEEIKAFFREHHLTFTALLDKEGKAFELYKTWSLPTTYLIDKDGEMVGRVIGYRDWDSKEARAFFHRLLEGKA